MPQLFYTPYGFRDHLSDESWQRRSLQQHLQTLFLMYGYRLAETPMVEYMELFDRVQGSVHPKDMYRFVDRDGEMLVMRPDMTPALARMASFYYRSSDLPIRVTSSGSTFRYNTQYSAKQRQLFQSGIELYGFGTAEEDAEVLMVAIQSLHTLGLTDYRITIGHAGLIRDLLEDLQIPEASRDIWAKRIESKNEIALKQDAKALGLNDQSWMLVKLMTGIGDHKLLEESLQLAKNLDFEQTARHLSALLEIDRRLSEYPVGKDYLYDPGMQPELSYYTGMIFKGYAYGCAAPLLDGGRYDALLKQMHTDWAAVGFGVYQDHVLQALKAQHLGAEPVQFLLAIVDSRDKGTATGLIETLRRADIPVTRVSEETVCEEDLMTYAERHDAAMILEIHPDICTLTSADGSVYVQAAPEAAAEAVLQLFPAEGRLRFS